MTDAKRLALVRAYLAARTAELLAVWVSPEAAAWARSEISRQ